MRTRRSPRNQERLFRAIGKELATAQRCETCVSYMPYDRGKGECILLGVFKRGSNEQRSCWRGKK